MKLRRWLGDPRSNVGHIQIAGPPDRVEPDAGELNYAWLLPLIDALGYSGWVGCEYRPAAGTEAGLGWGRPWGIRPPIPNSTTSIQTGREGEERG